MTADRAGRNREADGGVFRPIARISRFLSSFGRVIAVCGLAGAAAGCAAGHIAPMSAPDQPLAVGLSEPQVELRIQADALRRTPWDASGTAGEKASFSVGALFGILVDGMETDGAQDGATMRTAAVDAPTLSDHAADYVDTLRAKFAGMTERVDAVDRALTARTALTRRFLSAASHVVASHRMHTSGAGDQETAQADLTLIVDTVARLKDQHATFAEVALALSGQNKTAQTRDLTAPLAAWMGEIEALDVLKRSIAAGSLS